jgi:hypothetical protein
MTLESKLQLLSRTDCKFTVPLNEVCSTFYVVKTTSAKFGMCAGNIKFGLSVGNIKFGLSAGNIKFGLSAGNIKFGLSAENFKFSTQN